MDDLVKQTHIPERIWVDFEPRDWPTERIMYGDMDHPYVKYVCADRIESLTEQRDAARRDAVEAEAYATEVEAKLAQAVEALDRVLAWHDKDKYSGGKITLERSGAFAFARATLSEIGSDK